METLPPEVAAIVSDFLAPGLTVCVYAAVRVLGYVQVAFDLPVVPRRQFSRLAALIGVAVGVGFALSPFTSVVNLASQALAGGVIGLAASGLREATRKVS